MIERFVAACFQHRGLIGFAFLLLAGYGWYSWTQLSIEAYPDISDTSAQVITQVPGLAAEEVEQQITVPLEQEIIGIPGMHIMRSNSTFGLSLITIVFQDGVEDYWARQRLRERLGNVELPYGARPELDPMTSPVNEIYRYTLESKNRSIRDLSELQVWKVIPRLKMVPGVIEVSNFGGYTTRFLIKFDPDQLIKYNITLNQITETINANNTNAGGSIVDVGEQGFVVRGVGLITGLEDLGNIILTQKKGVPVLIKDLGEVKLSHAKRKGVLGKDDNPDAIQGITLMLRGENAQRVLTEVHQAVRELNENILPKDVKIVPYLDRANLIAATIKTVARTLVEGIVLVTIVLLLFLGSPRAALIVACTIPLSLLFAFVFMYHFKIPANLLSLGAIDFGILVDGAIVMLENILRRREENAGRALTSQEILAAALQVTPPIFFGMLVIITAYFPLFAFQRIEYKLFTPMAYTIGFALIGALAAALMLVPGLAYQAYAKPRRIFHNPVLDWLAPRYEKVLSRLVDRPRRAVLAFALTLLAVIGFGGTIGRDFLPYLDEGSIWLQVTLPPGISLNKAREMSDELRRVTREFKEVAYVVSQLGRTDDGMDPWTPSHVEAMVGLHPYDTWKPRRSKEELIEQMARRFARMPGFHVGFAQPISDMVLDKVAGAHSDLVIKIYGNDFAEARRIAAQVEGELKAIKGASDVIIDQQPPLPQMRITVDRYAAARFGINVADIADLISTGLGGKPIAQVFIEERHYDVAVRFTREARDAPGDIGNLLVTSPAGTRIPLAQVADIRLVEGQSTITREMAKRHLTVRVNVRGRDLASFLREAQGKIDTQVPYDHSRFHIGWGGQFENQNRAQARLALILPMVLALMFLLLFSSFRNLRQPALILLAVPLATLGGLVALHLRGMTLNVSSAVGFIALFGVAVLNAIIMITNLNRWRTEEGVSLREAVLQGARERMRPVLMTATVAALGLTPAALARSLGSDVQRPLATVVVGGLITATALTLLLLSALYYLMESWKEKRAGGHAPETTTTDPQGSPGSDRVREPDGSSAANDR
ncbi:MAG: efflux RND transporter permease subunit [Deltaproteobacteria bacterium]|nr:efflux RND transporter permease subunit [Deltaproteobacteria bacterium]